MNAFRGSRTLHLIALLALIAQLPMRHAAAMAHAGSDPLLLAFCGSASPVALQRLRAAAPPELLQALVRTDAKQKAAAQPACDFCAGLAAMQLAALPPSQIALFLSSESDAASSALIATHAAAAPARLPPPRGPPLNA
ncbi:MAG: hypothetical protein JWQ90_4865 [Hydrocarboniphaga sp.]|uniref:hypothetical protein n=1 Tax=Hydrocarboniphaga sp. TaxID=2033016 RepID=UPI002620DEA8|nr:hypothetical protein [Hydrocarboniphaga sp.]MDB5972415.1 hypothetical protein [Hydrocarboniphaga sp.]